MPQLLDFHASAGRHFPGCRYHIRTFINARIKWYRDTYLDKAVEREKNLKPVLSLKNLIVSQPSQTISLSTISPLKPNLNLPTNAEKFIKNYPLIFKFFLPPDKSNPQLHVKLTPKALSLHNDEMLLLGMLHYRKDVAERLARFLMLTGSGKLPLYLIEMFKYDLGLPHDYLLTLLVEFPDYFQICDMGFRDSNGDVVFGLELVSWRDNLAISEMEKTCSGMKITYSTKLPRGFDLEKRVMEWMDKWQALPYISPYENAFHLAPNGEHAEKWTVGVIHELLSLLVSKKTERENLFCFGDFLGFGRLKIKNALVHFPGIFYVSNKITTQTAVLRGAYEKNLLCENHPLMVMRNSYISLMNMVLRRGKPIRTCFISRKKQYSSRRGQRRDDGNRMSRSDNDEED